MKSWMLNYNSNGFKTVAINQNTISSGSSFIMSPGSSKRRIFFAHSTNDSNSILRIGGITVYSGNLNLIGGTTGTSQPRENAIANMMAGGWGEEIEYQKAAGSFSSSNPIYVTWVIVEK